MLWPDENNTNDMFIGKITIDRARFKDSRGQVWQRGSEGQLEWFEAPKEDQRSGDQ